MEKEFNGYSLTDDLNACAFPIESLLGILCEMRDDDLSGYIQRLADLAQHDMGEKLEAIASIIKEFIGEIELENGPATGEPLRRIERLRFRPAQRLVAAVRTTTLVSPEFTIGIPGGWENWAKKQRASSLGKNDIEAPCAPQQGSTLKVNVAEAKGG